MIVTKVSELIDPSTGVWDSALVNNIFWEQDAKKYFGYSSKARYDG
jgi:hypothetical protein